MRNKVLEMGRIINTHGLKGEMKVDTWTDEQSVFKGIKFVYIDKNGTRLEINSVRYQNKNIIIKAAGIDTIEEAEKLKGKILYVDRGIIGEPMEGRFYICDLLGIKVYDSGKYVGIIDDVIAAGSSNVYVIKRDGMKDLLIPAIPDVVLNTDIDAEEMQIKMIDGLDEL